MTTIITGDWIALEVPHQGEPTAWSGFGVEMYLSLTYRRAERCDRVIYERVTVRELASLSGLMADATLDDFNEVGEAWIFDLALAHGWDTPLYRSDFAGRYGEYSPNPIDEVEAAEAYNAHDLSSYSLVTSADECRDLLARLTGPNAPRIGKCGPVCAAWALRREAEEIGWIEPITNEESEND